MSRGLQKDQNGQKEEVPTNINMAKGKKSDRISAAVSGRFSHVIKFLLFLYRYQPVPEQFFNSLRVSDRIQVFFRAFASSLSTQPVYQTT